MQNAGLFDNHLFRPSSAHKLMTDPKKGETGLSVTCKTHLREIYIKIITGREKSISSKYLEKGIAKEQASITLYSRFSGIFCRKNEERKNGAFLSGECDILLPDRIVDTKTSWDVFTFESNFNEPPDKAYYWQGQAYMSEDLFNRKKYTIAYCLVNTPDKMIEDEKRRLLWSLPIEDDYEEACIELESSLKFDDIDLRLRVIEQHFDRNEEDIRRLQNRIIECREWLNNYHALRTAGLLLTDLK